MGIKIGLRASRNSQSCWTFIGLATRIAYSLGLHRDGDGTSLNAHEAEGELRSSKILWPIHDIGFICTVELDIILWAMSKIHVMRLWQRQ